MANGSILGRLTRDPEIKEVNTSVLAEFTLADDEGFGERKVTTFWRCTLWGQRATRFCELTRKGRLILVTGTLQVRQFLKQDETRGFSAECRVDQWKFAGPDTTGLETQTPATQAPATEKPAAKDNADEPPF